MRIIAGTYKGRSIAAPKGDVTRPTTDRVRESIMSSTDSIAGGFEGAHVLDAFAGSGAMGLEALSRGAYNAVFCDTDRFALEALKHNVSDLGLSPENATILRTDILKSGFPGIHAPYDIVFLDPPYRFDASRIIGLANEACLGGVFGNGCVMVYEHDAGANDVIDRILEGSAFAFLRRKKYGSTYVDYLEAQI